MPESPMVGSGSATKPGSLSKSVSDIEGKTAKDTMETPSDHSLLKKPGIPQSILFSVDYSEPGAPAPTALGGSTRRSIVVRIEPQDVLFILNATEPAEATATFAEAVAKRTAWSALEKDIPTGIEIPLSARQLDRVPPEIENRLPDFCMNGNKAWLFGPGEIST
jgi:hypothetical protein